MQAKDIISESYQRSQIVLHTDGRSYTHYGDPNDPRKHVTQKQKRSNSHKNNNKYLNLRCKLSVEQKTILDDFILKRFHLMTVDELYEHAQNAGISRDDAGVNLSWYSFKRVTEIIRKANGFKSTQKKTIIYQMLDAGYTCKQIKEKHPDFSLKYIRQTSYLFYKDKI